MKKIAFLIFLGFHLAAPCAGAGEIVPGDTPVANVLSLGLPAYDRVPNDGRGKAEYGEYLFNSGLLSNNQGMSCSSCHISRLGFADLHPQAQGIDGQLGRRRTPPLLNLYNAKALMLDGRAAGLGDQIHIPLESPTEMRVDWTASLGWLQNRPETARVLAASPGTKLDRDLVIASLAAYVGTLVAGNSAFDRYYFGHDEAAIDQQAKDGFRLFVRKGRCSGCHQVTGESALLTDDSFHSTGIGFADGAYRDEGRFEVTGNPADKGLFRTPTLRNAALRPYFMHDGSLKSLREVIDYYNRGGNRGAPNLDGRIQPLYLSEDEIQAMLAFLRTLNSQVVSYRPWLKDTGAKN
jgi:cytochrome c peroxidase